MAHIVGAAVVVIHRHREAPAKAVGGDFEECDDWDAVDVDGSSWTVHAGIGCEELSYTHTR